MTAYTRHTPRRRHHLHHLGIPQCIPLILQLVARQGRAQPVPPPLLPPLLSLHHDLQRFVLRTQQQQYQREIAERYQKTLI